MMVSIIFSFATVLMIKYISDMPDQVPAPPTYPFMALFVLGIVCTVMSALGFWAAWIEHRPLMLGYGIIMFMIVSFLPLARQHVSRGALALPPASYFPVRACVLDRAWRCLGS